MTSTDTSQVKPPREYKFVGAFSRRRRGRNGTASSRSTGPKRRTNAASKTQDESIVPTRPSPKSDHKMIQRGDVARGQARGQAPMAPTSSTATSPGIPDFQASFAWKVSPTCEQNDNATESQLMPNPSSVGAGQDSEADWSFSSFMSPHALLDGPGPSSATPFHHIHDTCQFSTEFGPDIPLAQTDDALTETSPRDDYMESALPDAHMSGATAEPPFPAGEMFLLPPSPQQAPCSISTTITHLLARCKCRIEYSGLCLLRYTANSSRQQMTESSASRL